MRANLTTSNTTNTPKLGPENHIQQNEWAVASAAQALLGRVSPNALAVALALAAHVPFDGSRLKVWPSRQRLLFMCGIGSKSTLSRVLEELECHGLIEVGRSKDRRKSNRYILNYVTVPEHVVARTLRAVERASQTVETLAVRGTETGHLRSPKTVHESLQCNSLKKKEEKRARTRSEGERGRHDPPPRSSGKTFASHPLSSAFEAKAPRPLAKPVECVEPTEQGRREWARAKILELAGPDASKHLGEGRTKEQEPSTSRKGRGDKAPPDTPMPDKRPWLKVGMKRQQWLRKERREKLAARHARPTPIYQDTDIRAS